MHYSAPLWELLAGVMGGGGGGGITRGEEENMLPPLGPLSFAPSRVLYWRRSSDSLSL